MTEAFVRTEKLLGETAMSKLKASHVAVFGIGGVGSFAAEALARSGIGRLTLVDRDTVCESNINRQLIANVNTIGRLKVDVMRERILAINPGALVCTKSVFYLPENADQFDFAGLSYIVDAIDTVTSKIELISRAKGQGIPVISSMGAGNKLDPTLFEVADIEDTSVCPLARVMRRELKKRGISSVKAVFSKEPPAAPRNSADGPRVPGSVSFVPSVAGLIIAGEVIKDIAGIKR
ncbi:MAG: tRNA threonylcarbamoyladenosine dehydratase [Bacillota bacterium]|nr:tRNA threonylcarbamoyladenosine dehydratase [Bacillota bacterium]